MEKELALIKLIEECSEVIQAATKCIRFGYNTYCEGYGHNNERLESEIADVEQAINKLRFTDKPIKIYLTENL